MTSLGVFLGVFFLVWFASSCSPSISLISPPQGFEDNIRKNRTVISNWIKYAQWEESLKEIQRYNMLDIY